MLETANQQPVSTITTNEKKEMIEARKQNKHINIFVLEVRHQKSSTRKQQYAALTRQNPNTKCKKKVSIKTSRSSTLLL
jgi:hypothetical protein